MFSLLSPSFAISLALTHSDPDKFQITSNEAYNVVGGRAGSGRVGESMRQHKPPPGPTSSSFYPVTAADVAADYEPV